MKILQISNYYFPNIGGIEQTARNTAIAFKRFGINDQMVLCYNTNAEGNDIKCRQNENTTNFVDSIKVVRVGSFAKVFSQSIITSYGSILERQMRDFQPDVIILHWPNPVAALYLEKYLNSKVKFVLYYHSDIIKQRVLEKFFVGITKSLLGRADIVVATSSNYIEGSKYLKHYKDKCFVMQSPINEDNLQIDIKSESLINDIKNKYRGKILCFAFGRHVEYKGFKYLIECSKYLDKDIAIAIGGECPLTGELKKLAEQTGKDIEILGRLSREEIIAYTNACDIFCFPSVTKNEAFGLSLAEGMYAGKPAVTFKIEGSGVSYVSLDGVTGIECENSNAKSYADAINKLAKDENLRLNLGRNAAKRVKENFLYATYEENVGKLLDKIAKLG